MRKTNGFFAHLRGISLTELLLVIAIIAILGAIAIPLITGVPASARDAVARDTLENLNRAVNAYRMAAGALPGEPGSEAAVLTLLTTRDPKLPGSPFFRGETNPVVSSDPATYRAAWDGKYFVLLAPGTSGEGLVLPPN